MNFPADLKYTKDHEWIKLLDNNTALVGVTYFAQQELGDIVFVDITAVNKILSAEDIFGTIEAVKTVSDLFMPVAGKVLEVNNALAKNPELVNNDPYGEGWMVKIEISNPQDVAALLDAAAYEEMVS